MRNETDQAANQLVMHASNENTLTRKLEQLHGRILLTIPVVDRIACAVYDKHEDLLKTFINSTRHGKAITGYEYRLSNSESLSRLARTGEYRVLESIPDSLSPINAHSEWLLKQGYQSSFTVPMNDGKEFLGFIFFDSTQPGAFTPAVQRDLVLYCSLINMTITNELLSLRSLTATAEIARDFSNLRDFETGAHLERMAQYSRLIAREISAAYRLDDEFIEHMFLFAPLHDIGKIGIPDSILLKPGKLTDEERKIMEGHVDKGYDIVKKIIGDAGLGALSDSQVMTNIVYCHHECLDGSGYPRKLKGDEVPVEARIVTVADIYDALTTKRPYKEPWSSEDACKELDRLANLGKLDPHCVKAMRNISADAARIQSRYRDIE